MKLPLQVFARPPVAGEVKTRLAAELGPARAAALYRAFLADVLATCSRGPFDVTLWVAGDPEHPALLEVPGARSTLRVAQPAGDLGARMASALGEAIARSGAGLVVGSDAPDLPASLLNDAHGSLAGSDLVLGPAADGGYYLIGARGRVPPVFAGVEWSTSRVLDQTCALAAAAGLRVHRLRPWHDVDIASDLGPLRARLALDPSAAPATARALGALGD